VQVDKFDAMLPHESLPLVIKSTWLPERLYDHELEILGHIDRARNRCLANGTSVPLLPFPVGHAINTISGSKVRLDGWRTADGHTRNTTMVTFCETGRHVDQDLPTLRTHVRLHRSLTQTLGWLAKNGIHYRDLNSGNVLRNDAGKCVLIDFGNARYRKRPRGQTRDQATEPLALSWDDARSGTFMFMSRRIHALTIKAIMYKEAEAKYEIERLKLKDTDASFWSSRIRKIDGRKQQLEQKLQQMKDIHNQHCYIDEAESQLYLMMQQVRNRIYAMISHTHRLPATMIGTPCNG
jgi:hypothetical protein